MYKDYLKIRPCKTGMGVFTTVTIPAGVPIIEFRGDLFKSDETKHPDSEILQIGPNTFMGPSGDIDDYVNHSCAPNCIIHIVGNRAILYSRFLITPDSEITFDYSTSSTDTPDIWKMDCQCGSPNCRRTISGFSSLDAQTQEMYKNKGMIPSYIAMPHMFQKK